MIAKPQSIEWDRVADLAASYANAINLEDAHFAENARQRLLRQLVRLEARYGKQPFILATRADYIKGIKRRITLLKSALQLAQRRKNLKEITLCTSSICSIYIEEMRDANLGVKWIRKLDVALRNFSDKEERAFFNELNGTLKTMH